MRAADYARRVFPQGPSQTPNGNEGALSDGPEVICIVTVARIGQGAFEKNQYGNRREGSFPERGLALE